MVELTMDEVNDELIDAWEKDYRKWYPGAVAVKLKSEYYRDSPEAKLLGNVFLLW